MNLKLKKKKLLLIIIFLNIFFLIFIYEIPRKAFNILRLDYDQRLQLSYDYCFERGVGFLVDIKKKYKLDKPPNFIKYTGVRNPGWVFFDRKNKDKSDYYVLLNYNNDNEIILDKLGFNQFKYNFSHNYNHKKFKQFLIVSDNLKNLKLKIFRDNKKIFEKEYIKNEIVFKTSYFKIDINNSLNSILKDNQYKEANLIFQFENISTLSDIRIHLEHIYDLSLFNILEKNSNCYLVKFND
jgi:hypothetical protein